MGEWFRTGDLGQKDEEPATSLSPDDSRNSSSAAARTSRPREIDDVLYKHDAILEAAAVGVDDDNYGQEVVACVVVRDGYRATEEELKAVLRGGGGQGEVPQDGSTFWMTCPRGRPARSSDSSCRISSALFSSRCARSGSKQYGGRDGLTLDDIPVPEARQG